MAKYEAPPAFIYQLPNTGLSQYVGYPKMASFIVLYTVVLSYIDRKLYINYIVIQL